MDGSGGVVLDVVVDLVVVVRCGRGVVVVVVVVVVVGVVAATVVVRLVVGIGGGMVVTVDRGRGVVEAVVL